MLNTLKEEQMKTIPLWKIVFSSLWKQADKEYNYKKKIPLQVIKYSSVRGMMLLFSL